MRFQTRGWLLTGSDQRLRLITVGSFGRRYKVMGGGSGLAGISIENTNILLTGPVTQRLHPVMAWVVQFFVGNNTGASVTSQGLWAQHIPKVK